MPDVSLLVIVRVAALALTLWGGYILLAKTLHRQNAAALNIAWPAVTLSVFIWSMGWLT